MARAATTSDVFNAVAEPRRRQIIDLLAAGQRLTVTQLIAHLEAPQPAVSKHLSVLRQVGLVQASKEGRLRVYELNAQKLKPVHDWVKTFERFWAHQLDRIKVRAERKAKQRIVESN